MNDYKKFAKEHGEQLMMHMLKMEYFKWDDKWVQVRELEDHSENFADQRDRLLAEQMFINELYPYVAYITAPNRELSMSVIQMNYAVKKDRDFKIKKALGIPTDGLGLNAETTITEAKRNEDRFAYRFKKISEYVEKGLNKIRVVPEVLI